MPSLALAMHLEASLILAEVGAAAIVEAFVLLAYILSAQEATEVSVAAGSLESPRIALPCLRKHCCCFRFHS